MAIHLRFLLCVLLLVTTPLGARDLAQIRDDGTLRHLGVPYANFVTGSGDGLDVELIRGFAEHLGLRYEFVQTDWATVFGDLTGRHARRSETGAERLGSTPIRGDLIANGMTVLDWRRQVVAFSEPTFPSGVWLIAGASSSVSPIEPSGELGVDIANTKARLDGLSVLALTNTCLDPGLYQLERTRAEVRLAPDHLKLNEMVPAMLNREAETTLLDVPDALVALERWPGRIKVVGPISDRQEMAVAFRPESVELREAFNDYLTRLRAAGTYRSMVNKYYPAVFDYFADFFSSPGRTTPGP